MSAKSSDLIRSWSEDLAPLRHITAESVRGQAILHRMTLIVWLHDFLYFIEISWLGYSAKTLIVKTAVYVNK